MIEPIGWEYDLGFRVAARYGLDFFITSEYSLIERGEYNPESREPTFPELSMWSRIVPNELRELLSKLWMTTDRLTIEAVPEELFCGLLYKRVVYLNAADFAHARKLRDFRPELDPGRLRAGKNGSFRDADIFVSRGIPKGYSFPTDIPIPDLNWQPPPGVRQLRPELDPRIEGQVVLSLRPLRQEKHCLRGEVVC
jgi:hypothetical protein